MNEKMSKRRIQIIDLQKEEIEEAIFMSLSRSSIPILTLSISITTEQFYFRERERDEWTERDKKRYTHNDGTQTHRDTQVRGSKLLAYSISLGAFLSRFFL